jgi:hypothetical protein
MGPLPYFSSLGCPVCRRARSPRQWSQNERALKATCVERRNMRNRTLLYVGSWGMFRCAQQPLLGTFVPRSEGEFSVMCWRRPIQHGMFSLPFVSVV